MTGNKFLLDTNIIIEVFNNNKAIADKIYNSAGLNISSITVGELYVGVNRVTNKAKHLRMLHEFLELCTVLDADSDTARYYGEISAALYKKGKPIPSNDIWIAATARQYDLILVSNDKHFKEVEHLILEVW